MDTRSGEYFESVSSDRYGLGPALGTIAGAMVPGFPDPDRYYEMGFEWLPDLLRFFSIFDAEEITLWEFRRTDLIPQEPATFRFNLWHTPFHWFAGRAADYPANDATMRVDWFRYWDATR